METIKQNGIYCRVYSLDEDLSVIKDNVATSMIKITNDDENEGVYKFNGFNIPEENQTENGIYINTPNPKNDDLSDYEDYEIVIIGEPIALLNDIIIKDDNKLDNILNKAAKITKKKQSTSKTVNKNKTSQNTRTRKEKRKLTGGRVNRNDILQLKIEDDDDMLVKLVKEEINSRSITMNDIYDLVGSSNGYNLFYGLSTRSTLTWTTFEKWCDILNVVPELIIRAK